MSDINVTKLNDLYGESVELISNVKESVAKIERFDNARELALVATKLDEARLWLAEASAIDPRVWS